jgi:protein gp37
VSAGCDHCYAASVAFRFSGPGQPYEGLAKKGADGVPRFTGAIRLVPENLTDPLRWQRPRRIFVNSMSDLFHELVPVEFVQRVFDVMKTNERHTFQVLTKRPEYALEIADALEWPANVWLGVSIENSRFTHRADVLREIPAAVRFISAEPLLGSLFERGTRKAPLDLARIDWLIAGGESGAGYRPVNVEWLRELRGSCADAGVAFFFKQWGGRTPKSGGRVLDGAIHNELPVAHVAAST